jgi:leucyl/phenylalanyl-tRNA---protein transferase
MAHFENVEFENLAFGQAALPHPDYPGLVAVGGKVTADTMLAAYCQGAFPWYCVGEPIMWWSPDPRAILEFADFHISHRLGRTIRSGKFHCTIDQQFTAVVRGCADPQTAGRAEGTWLTPAMMIGFAELHRRGVAHSVEVWQGGELAGGIFGTALGGFFAGESMFHRERDASKVALAFLVEHVRAAGFQLFDLQVLSPHTALLGAKEISREEYLLRLRGALPLAVCF